MNVLRKGSRGDDVKRLQGLLGVAADGIFGNDTERAVKEFQRAKGLTADGIVGARTWAELEDSGDSGYSGNSCDSCDSCDSGDSEGIAIVDGHIDTHVTRLPKRNIRYIAIHYTAGRTSGKGAAMSTRGVFLAREASADFVVDDETIVRINPDLRNYYCWSVGDKKNPYTGGGRLSNIATNRNTISIEICSNLKDGASALYANHGGWYFTEASLDNARRLVRYLMREFGIPKDRVVRHYDISGKLCPGVVGWNDFYVYQTDGKITAVKSDSREWEKFLSGI